MNDKIETRVVGHREAHYLGEPKSQKETLELVNFPSLREPTDPVRKACYQTIKGLVLKVPKTIARSTEKTSANNLLWMLERCLAEINSFPLDKLNRWIGFVQGVLAMSGHLDVDKERDRTRSLFHQAYIDSNQSIPETTEMPNEDLRLHQTIDDIHQPNNKCG